MATLNLTIPDDLDTLIASRIARGGFGDVEAYLRKLIDRDLERERAARRALEESLREAMKGEFVELTDELWDRIEREASQETTPRSSR